VSTVAKTCDLNQKQQEFTPFNPLPEAGEQQGNEADRKGAVHVCHGAD